MTKDHRFDVKIEAISGKQVMIEDGHFIANAQFHHEGNDLYLTSPDGHTVMIEGYFSQTPPPDITTKDGGRLSPDLVDSFLVTAQHPGQYAEAAHTVNDASPAGKITQIQGEAVVVHADGTKTPATLGMAVMAGDVIQTSAKGAVNLLFTDNTTFAISENARLSIDQYVYNAHEQSGSTFFSMLQGVFVYTSGLIGKHDPAAVSIETPVGSIGIRGTVVAGTIAPPGQESKITIVDGAIVVSNTAGTLTLSNGFQTISLTNDHTAPVDHGQISVADFSHSYQSLTNVASDTFSHLDTFAAHAAAANAPPPASDTHITPAPIPPAATSPGEIPADTHSGQSGSAAPTTAATTLASAPAADIVVAAPPQPSSTFGELTLASTTPDATHTVTTTGSSTFSATSNSQPITVVPTTAQIPAAATSPPPPSATAPALGGMILTPNDFVNNVGVVKQGSYVTYTVDFHASVDGTTVTTADFGNAGSASVNVNFVTQISPSMFQVGVKAISTSGTIQLEVLPGADIKDAFGHALDTSSAIVSNTSVTVDSVAPSIASINIANGDADNLVKMGDTLNYTLNFNENIDISTVSAADFVNAGSAGISIGNITETSAGVVHVAVTTTSAGTLQFGLAAGAAINDIAGNTFTVATPILETPTVSVDGTKPVLNTFANNDSDGIVKVGDVVHYTLNFSENIDAATVSASDFVNAGTAGIGITGITETTPGVFDLDVTATSAGTLHFGVGAGGTIADIAGNLMNTSTAVLDTATLTVDGTPPELASGSFVNGTSMGYAKAGDVLTYTVTFTEDIDSSTVAAADFGNAGTAGITIGAVTETSPGVFTAQVTATSEGTLQLKINQGAVITDVAGNQLNTATALIDGTTVSVGTVGFNFADFYTHKTATTSDDGLPLFMLDSSNLTYNNGSIIIGTAVGISTPTDLQLNIASITGNVLEYKNPLTFGLLDTTVNPVQPVFHYDSATKELLLDNPWAIMPELNPGGFTFTVTGDSTLTGLHFSKTFTLVYDNPNVSVAGTDTVQIGDYGGSTNPSTTSPLGDTLDSSAPGIADVLIGRSGGDNIFGNGGADTLIGNDGDDHFFVKDAGFHFIDGGAGNDTLTLGDTSNGGSATTYDFTQGNLLHSVRNIEAIYLEKDFSNANSSNIILNIQDVFEMTNDPNQVNGGMHKLDIYSSATPALALANVTGNLTITDANGTGFVNAGGGLNITNVSGSVITVQGVYNSSTVTLVIHQDNATLNTHINVIP